MKSLHDVDVSVVLLSLYDYTFPGKDLCTLWHSNLKPHSDLNVEAIIFEILAVSCKLLDDLCTVTCWPGAGVPHSATFCRAGHCCRVCRLLHDLSGSGWPRRRALCTLLASHRSLQPLPASDWMRAPHARLWLAGWVRLSSLVWVCTLLSHGRGLFYVSINRKHVPVRALIILSY